jgi:hypothetical protein
MVTMKQKDGLGLEDSREFSGLGTTMWFKGSLAVLEL